MQSNALIKQIRESYTRGDTEALEETVTTALRQHRDRAIGTLETLLEDADGKLRLKILEILLIDGAPDLIPLYVAGVRWEKNALYGKSIILLFRELRHQEALAALLSIESDIDRELEGTYQRTLGRLLSNFSEQFYMAEMRAGIGNPRRVRFAADMMLRAPHPEYVPFVNELIQTNDVGYRQEGLRLLRALGDASSSKAVFAMMGKLDHQRRGLDRLMRVLDTEDRDPRNLFAELVGASGIDWDGNQTDRHADAVGRGEIEEAVELLLDAFELAGEVRRKSKPLIKGLLSESDPSTFQEMRTAQALQEHADALVALMKTSTEVLGTLAVKQRDEAFLQRLEDFFPADHPLRDKLLIAAMAGYRNQTAFQMLVDYANTCDDEDLLAGTLDALGAYTAETLPKGVEKLCFDTENGILRRKAVDLVSAWGLGGEITLRLIGHEALAVRADGIRAAAEHQIEEAYPEILALLESPEVPDSLVVPAIEGIAAFDDVRTVRALRPLLLPPNTPQVRKAALEALFNSHANDRIEQIVKAILQIGPEKIWDSVDRFLDLILQHEIEPIHDAVLAERELWLKLMMKDVRGERHAKLLELAERLDIDDAYQARAWVLGLKKVLAQMEQVMGESEKARAQTLLEVLEDRIRVWNERAKNEKLLESLIEGVRTKNPYQKVQGLRNLAQRYSRELVADNPEALQAILDAVIEELDAPQPKKEMLLRAIEVAQRVRHPKLHARLEKFVRFPDFDVRKAANKARGMSLDPDLVRPIETVFVMDDSRYITKQLAKVLARAGYEVDYENRVHDGLDRLAGTRFDLLILDIVMPELEGDAFLERARQGGFAPDSVLVITSSRNNESLQPMIAMGIDGIILKPFRMEDLIEKIEVLSRGGG